MHTNHGVLAPQRRLALIMSDVACDPAPRILNLTHRHPVPAGTTEGVQWTSYAENSGSGPPVVKDLLCAPDIHIHTGVREGDMSCNEGPEI